MIKGSAFKGHTLEHRASQPICLKSQQLDFKFSLIRDCLEHQIIQLFCIMLPIFLVYECDKQRQKVITQILSISKGYFKKPHTLTASEVQTRLQDLKAEMASKDSDITDIKQKRQERINELMQQITVEQTKEDMYRKNLSDVNKQLASLRGNEAENKEKKREFTEIEEQLSTLQERLCEIIDTVKEEFQISLKAENGKGVDIGSSLEENFCAGPDNTGILGKFQQSISEQEDKVKKGEVKLQKQRAQVTELEVQLRHHELLESEFQKKIAIEADMKKLIDQANELLTILKLDKITNLSKVDFKELIKAVSLRSQSKDQISFAIQELKSLAKKLTSLKPEEKATQEDQSSLEDITTQLDKYISTELNYRSTIDTIRKLHRMSKKKHTDGTLSCFLCKSTISEQALQQIEANFLKDESANSKNEQKIATERKQLMKLIEKHNGSESVCESHRDKVILGEIEARIEELQKHQKGGKQVDTQLLQQLIMQIENMKNSIEGINCQGYQEGTVESLRGESAKVGWQVARMQKELEKDQQSLKYCKIQIKFQKISNFSLQF